MKVKPEIRTSVSILDSEDLIDTAYNGLLHCLEWFPGGGTTIPCVVVTGNKSSLKEMDHFYSFIDGIYYPGIKRNYWYGSFDIHVDDVPDHCCVWVDTEKHSSLEYVVVNKVRQFPPKVSCGIKEKNIAHIFKTSYVAMPDRNREIIPDPLVYVSYFAMEKDGSIWTAIDMRKFREYNPHSMTFFDNNDGAHFGPGALSLTADQKYLWMVETKEKTNWGVDAKVKFGLDAEMVKSLFFARESPLTETGRKKPILHWVSEHKRRIKENIEIDIEKYLRGTTTMFMGNMEFNITSPIKK